MLYLNISAKFLIELETANKKYALIIVITDSCCLIICHDIASKVILKG